MLHHRAIAPRWASVAMPNGSPKGSLWRRSFIGMPYDGCKVESRWSGILCDVG